MKYSSEQLVKEALESDKKCLCPTHGRLYLISWVWAREKYLPDDPCFTPYLNKFFKFFLTHKNPDTIVREKEKLVLKGVYAKDKYETTDELARELIAGEVPMFKVEPMQKLDFEEQRRRLKEARNNAYTQ